MKRNAKYSGLLLFFLFTFVFARGEIGGILALDNTHKPDFEINQISRLKWDSVTVLSYALLPPYTIEVWDGSPGAGSSVLLTPNSSGIYRVCPDFTYEVRILDGTPLVPVPSGLVDWEYYSTGQTSLFDYSTNPVGVNVPPLFQTVVKVDVNGLFIDSIIIEPYTRPFASLAAVPNVICPSHMPLPLTSPINVGGIDYFGIYSMEVAGGAAFGPSGANISIDPANLSVGVNYNVLYDYTDQFGCSWQAQSQITLGDEPNITTTNPAAVCSNSTSLIPLSSYIQLNSIFPETPSWYNLISSSSAGLSGSTLGSTFDPGAAGVGTHVITVTYQIPGGCSDQEIITVTVNNEPDLSPLNLPLNICSDAGLLPLNDPPGYSGGTWSTTAAIPGILSNPGGTGWVLDPTSGPQNNVPLIYTPVAGCPAEHEIYIDASPSVSLAPSSSVGCAGPGTISLNGSWQSFSTFQSGTENYSVDASPSGAPPLIISPTGDIDLSSAVPGIYTIQYEFEDDNGCESETSVDITILSAPTITPISAINLCNGGADIDLNNSFSPPGGTYVINGTTLPSGTLSGSASFLTPTGNSLTYTYDNGTCSATYSTSFDLQSGPVIGVISSTFQESCPGAADATIVFNVLGNTGPLSYEWSNGSISSVPYSGLGVGSYTVTVSDATNCYSIETFQVTSPTAISGSTVVTNVSTNGGSDGAINLTPAGGTPGYTYAWSNGLPSTEDQSNIPAGTYNVTITDNNGCTGVLLGIQVAQPGPLVASGLAQNVTCNGQANGSIDLTVGGGFTPPDVPSYIYQWSNAAGTEDISGLAPGVYSVTVSTPSTSSDVQILSFTITEPAALTLSGVVNPVPCFAQSNGSIVTSVSGGTTPYSYLWDNGFVTPDRTNLLAGNYTVTVTDNSGCSISQTFAVTQPSGPFNIGFNEVDVSCFGGSDGEVNLTISGATPPYSFLWSNGATTQSIQNLTAATYTVFIEDANGCTFFYPAAIVTQPTALAVTSTITDVTNFGAMDGAISTATSGGTPSYSYAWSGPNSFTAITPNISNLNGGNYTLTVTDASGCTSIQSFNVIEPGQLTVTSLVTNETCVGSSNGAIDLTISSNGPATILWSNGSTIEDLSHLAVGSYTVTITDGPQVFDSTYTIGTATILDFNLTLPNDSFCLADALPLLGTNTNSATEVYKIDGQIVSGPVVPLSTYSVGPHLLTYIVSSGGCTDSTSLPFELLEPYPAVPQPSVLVCSTGLTTNLTVLLNSAASIALPDTGRWYDPSGTLLSSSNFDPMVDPYGIYTYRISNFCGETPYPIDIVPILNPIVFSAPASLCPNDGTIDLNNFVSPAGGSWTGGTTTGTFDPSLAIPGDTIWFYYSATTAGCGFTDSTSIRVLPFTAVQTDLTLVPTLCTADSSVTLQFASPAGGIYSSTTAQINLVGTDYVLDPGASGPAAHVIWYHYNDAVLGCSDSASVTLAINAATPTAIGPFIDSICVGAVPVTLPVGLPAGGQLTGPGVVGTDFDPASAGLGTHNLIYSFPNDPCFTPDTIQVTVTPPPLISMPNFGPVCTSDPSFLLTGATPAGGTWIGPNIVNNQFIPGLAGAGVHDLVYFYNLGGSCERYDTTTITVLSGPSLSLNTIPSICAGDPSVVLNVVNPAGGIYSSTTAQINLVGTDYVLDPGASGPAAHVIWYHYNDAVLGCSDSASVTLTINAATPTAIGPFIDSICVGAVPVTLPVGLPAGGQLTGPGVVGTDFDPASAGLGTHDLIYSFPNDPCFTPDTIQVTVTPPPLISMPNFGPVCTSDPSLLLTGATPAGGTWIGPNIVNNQFIPGLAGAGVHDLVYFYNLGGSCERYDTTTITVLSGPSLSLNTIPSICAGDPSVVLNVVNPAGGSYSGLGVQQGTFNPQVAGVGSHSVNYSYINSQGCISDTSFIITVSPLPVVTLLNLPSFCEEDSITPITNGSPTGGTYSGNGIVNGNEFDPGWAGAGSHFITYTFTDFNGCSNSDFGYIEVYPTPPTPHINKVYNYLVCDWGFYDYQWYLNGVPIPNSNFIKWNAVDTGYYQVQLINEWGCTNISDSLNVDFLYQVGMDEGHWSEVVLFPNPTSDWVRVELPIRPKALNYQWSNSMGQVVGEGTIESGSARQWSYDLSALPGGYYTLLLEDSDVSVRFKVLRLQ